MKNFVFFIIILLFLAGCDKANIGDKKYCSVDVDCVPADCCHATSCVHKDNAPDCSGIMCSMECAPGTLDCGQGRCVCVNNICLVEISK